MYESSVGSFDQGSPVYTFSGHLSSSQGHGKEMLGGAAGKIYTWLTLGHSSMTALPALEYVSADTVSSPVLGTGVMYTAHALGRP